MIDKSLSRNSGLSNQIGPFHVSRSDSLCALWVRCAHERFVNISKVYIEMNNRHVEYDSVKKC